MFGKRPVFRTLASLLVLLSAVQYGAACVAGAAVAGAGHHGAGVSDTAEASTSSGCCPQALGAECDGTAPPASPAADYECCVIDAPLPVPSAAGSRPGVVGAGPPGIADDGGDSPAAIVVDPAPPEARRSPPAVPSRPLATASAGIPLWLSTARLRL